jgi:glycine cleavage system aminomethyltransferase T
MSSINTRGYAYMSQVVFEIPNEVLYDNKMSSRDALDFARRATALHFYTTKGVSLGYCAQIAGMDKEDFIGRAALEAMGTPKRRKVGLKVTGRGIVREHQDVYLNGEKIGITTSGTFCPFLNGAYANALVDADHREIGTKVEVDVRGRRVECEIVKSQFYKR